MDSCAFCGRDETEVRVLFAGGGASAARPGMPAVHICDQCALRCADLVDESPAGEPPGPAAPAGQPGGARGAEAEARILVRWTPFVVDDRKLEWAAARVDFEGSPAILVSVRRPERSDSGVGVVYPDSTLPTVEKARETARSFWRQLE